MNTNRQPNSRKEASKIQKGQGTVVPEQAQNINLRKRSDSLLVARMAKMGCVEPETVSYLIAEGLRLATEAAKENDARRYANLMKTLGTLAKLDQNETPSQHLHMHMNETAEPNVLNIISELRQA